MVVVYTVPLPFRFESFIVYLLVCKSEGLNLSAMIKNANDYRDTIQPRDGFMNTDWQRVVKRVKFMIPIISLGLTLQSCTEPTQHTPNILLITYDTLRADHLGCYGYEHDTTPVLDTLAAEGILFENAFCQVPLTLPSHASILSGLQPIRHGIRINGAYRFHDSIPTLAEILHARGFATAAFVSAAVLNAQFGLDRGFDIYDDDVDRTPRQPFSHYAERPADMTVDRAVSWISSLEGDPFFLWIHLFDPHASYDPPEPYKSRYQDLPYDGEIAFADAETGRLLSTLSERYLLDKTLIIATADHGEALGEHGEKTHGLLIYDSTMHVPLIFRLPRISFPGFKQPDGWVPGSRISFPVQTVDLFPTILEITGHEETHPTDGMSLLNTADSSGERRIYAESWMPKAFGWAPLQSVRTREWKYIRAPQPELYDLNLDDGELDNDYSKHRVISDSFHEWLHEYSLSVNTHATIAKPLKDDDVQALESLGYIVDVIDDAYSEELWLLPDPKTRLSAFHSIFEARFLASKGKIDTAIAILKPLLNSESDNPTLHFTLGSALIENGDFSGGIEHYARYRILSGNTPESSYHLAAAHLRNNSPQKAIELLEEAISALPSYADAWNQLGIAYGDAGRTDLSLEASSHALSIEPDNPVYLKNRGVTFLRSGDPAEALSLFSRARDIDPGSTDISFHLALALIDTRDFAGAGALLEEIIRTDSTHLDARRRLVEVLYQMGRFSESMQRASRLLSRDPSDPIANMYLGLYKHTNGEHVAAVPHLKHAIRGMPSHRFAYITLARSLVATRNDPRAAAWLINRASSAGVGLPHDVKSALDSLVSES